MLGISGDNREDNNTVLQWIAKEGQKYPMISGREGKGYEIMNEFGGKAYPTILLIGPDKKILESFFDDKDNSPEDNSPDRLEAILEKHIGPTEIINTPDVLSFPQIVKHMGKSNSSLKIYVKTSGLYDLSLYSLGGKKILQHSNNYFSPGIHTISFNNNLSNGIFILRCKSNGYISKEKIFFKG